MDEKEKEIQRALGTLTWYLVTLKITKRAFPRMFIVNSDNKNGAFEEAILRYMKKTHGTIRRDQIILLSCTKCNF